MTVIPVKVRDNCGGCKEYTEHEATDWGQVTSVICLECDYYEEFRTDMQEEFKTDWRLW